MVVIGNYLDLISANLARAELESHGIAARVVEVAGFNPLYAGAAGGHQLHVDPMRADEARAILAASAPRVEDTEAADAVRCPRCEQAYCYYGRPRVIGAPAAAGVLAFASLVLLPLRFLFPAKWHCERCEHEWTDKDEGPRAATPLPKEEPLPVFVLGRRSVGSGVLLGLAVTGLGATLLPAYGPYFLLAPLLGYFIGHSRVTLVCSEPTCRAPILAGEERCPRCRGWVAGTIQTASAHYVRAAEYRRELQKELAALAVERPKKKKKLLKA